VQQARKAAEDDKPKKRTRTRKTRTKEELQADKERLDLIGRMNIARAAGNEAEVTALQEQLELARLIADYQDTGFSVESATQIATAQVEAVRNAALLREEKARALALSERELEIV